MISHVLSNPPGARPKQCILGYVDPWLHIYTCWSLQVYTQSLVGMEIYDFCMTLCYITICLQDVCMMRKENIWIIFLKIKRTMYNEKLSQFSSQWISACLKSLSLCLSSGYRSQHSYSWPDKQTAWRIRTCQMNDSNFWFLKVRSVIYPGRHILLTFHAHLLIPNKFPHPRATTDIWHWPRYIHFIFWIWSRCNYLSTFPICVLIYILFFIFYVWDINPQSKQQVICYFTVKHLYT